MHSIRVEFYGVARLASRCPAVEIPIPESGESIRLGDVLRQISESHPDFNRCLSNGSLTGQYVGNVDGERFVRDPDLRLHPGQTLLILSADAGG